MADQRRIWLAKEDVAEGRDTVVEAAMRAGRRVGFSQ
jgi:hypothetical protein